MIWTNEESKFKGTRCIKNFESIREKCVDTLIGRYIYCSTGTDLYELGKMPLKSPQLCAALGTNGIQVYLIIRQAKRKHKETILAHSVILPLKLRELAREC